MEFDFDFDFNKSPEYQKSIEWYAPFIRGGNFPNDKLGYWNQIHEYAKSRYEEVIEARKVIEEKADSLLKFVGTLAGALLAFFKVTGSLDTLGWRVYPSLTCFAIAAIFCLFARRTAAWPSPADIPRLAGYNCNEVELIAVLSASLHCSVEGAKWVVNGKARVVQNATVVAIVGLASLAFLFVRSS